MDKVYGATGKRTRSDLEGETNERNDNKKFNYGKANEPVLPGADSTVYRILCPANSLGTVIGKGGKMIKQLRKETRSKIKVAEPVPGVDERVIVIFSSPKDESNKGNVNGNKADDDNAEDDESEVVCPAQDGLLRVHSVIVKHESEKNKESEVTARLLVLNSQIGTFIGKGGKNIQKMRSDSGAQIQILRKDQLPPCALPVDELVQISGDATVVKKALHMVSAFLHKHPPKEHIPWKDIIPSGKQSSLVSSGSLLPSANYLPQGSSIFGHNNIGATFGGLSSHLPGLGGYTNESTGASWSLSKPGLPVVSSFGSGPTKKGSEDFTVRILCPSDKIGGVIGKGGNNIKQVRQETGASVKVEDAKPDSDERVIIVSSTEFSDDRISPTLEAILQLQGKTIGSTGKEGVIATRLLVPAKQIGCLIGKGGNVITEMRKMTRANIRIYSKDERPKSASEDEELVQITAEPSVARDALIQIVTRLRDNVFKDRDSATNAEPVLSNSLSGLALPSTFSLSSSYGARQELDLGSPGGMAGIRSAGGYGSLGALQGGASSYAPHSAYTASRTIGGGIYGKAIEVTIPNSAVGSVLGRGGSNISHICQVSGAMVKLHDPLPGASDHVIEILGTPEQQHAAQSLIQAYMLSGQSQQSLVPLRAY
uniref:TSA: Wollemia nobilis Ref_Wollemi_Transcript_9470_2796 transcribed RNA sequence n=1 Tax=Wollemia nobilis TaxID=56998 RepID=A0A0C9QU69_9CONI